MNAFHVRHHLLDPYRRLNSPVHRVRPAIKVVTALGLVLAVVVMPSAHPWYLLAVAVPVVLLTAMSRLPWSFVIGRLLLLETFVLGVALLALFQPDGWRIMLMLVARCTLCLLVMILLSGTTPFSQVLGVLRSARVPGLLVTTLALMYRYLFVLVDEAERMRRARRSRTFTRRRTRHWHALATVISQLFVRASERADRIYAAMCARGWH